MRAHSSPLLCEYSYTFIKEIFKNNRISYFAYFLNSNKYVYFECLYQA